MNNKTINYKLLIIGLVLSTACRSGEEEQSDTFDRRAFLENYAHNIIQPAAEDLLEEAEELQSAVDTLVGQKTVEHLQEAQTQWDETYRAWIKVCMLNFGPGGTEGRRRTLVEEVALWPIDVEGIEEKIRATDPSFNDSQRNTRGLLTVEYLLFAKDDADSVLTQLGENRGSYLQKTVDRLVEQLTSFNQAWQGDYATEFIASDGTDAKSSTTQMFNETVRNFEAVRDAKLGIPMGLIAGQSGPQPTLAEARFSQKSLDYLLLNYATIVNLWHGRHGNGEDGLGWEEYLLSIEGGEELVTTIQQQFDKIDSIIESIPKEQGLGELAQANNPEMAELHQAMQQLTRYLKGDSSSLLSLAITFSSGDGD
ncbi:MAG: imelysin family protein [Bacteroidota bacterium]